MLTAGAGKPHRSEQNSFCLYCNSTPRSACCSCERRRARIAWMPLYFRDELFDAQFLRTMGHSVYGGADIGECLGAARLIREKDTSGWFDIWMGLADRIHAEAERSQQLGNRISAREGFLRASNYYRNAYIFLFGEPKRLQQLQKAYEAHRSSFQRAVALMDFRVSAVKIPYERTRLNGYFFRTADGDERRPTLILNGGYDSTAEESYFWNGEAALRRGYHCLAFDGPGQGAAIIENFLPFRPDWEAVITPIVDWLQSQPGVDSQRIGIIGESLGGYLALRAATGEPRLRACVADPGQFSLFEIFRARVPGFLAEGLPELRGLSGALLRKILYARLKEPTAGWALRRGLWVHGVNSLEEYLRLTLDYSLEGRAERIQCPTLICFAEDDDLASTARKAYDALKCEKDFVTFLRSEGAGEHCEVGARLLFHQRTFDWLDQRLR